MKVLTEDFEPFDPQEGRDRPFAPPDAGRLEDSGPGAFAADGRDQDSASNTCDLPGLGVVSADSFAHLPTPQRRFLVPGANLLPVRNVSALYGDGGTGKSLLALQLAVAIASGTSWLGFMPEPGGCLYFSAEDDEDEAHIRLKSIVDGSEAEFAMLQNLHLVILAGQDAALAHEDAKGSRMIRTRLFQRLDVTLRELKPRLLILDNLADIFAGNENSKVLARQFIGLLRGLALRHDCTVLLLAHPSLSGLSSGTGTSGNTAWNNSVRARLYLKRQHDDAREITDPDYRRLVTMKANYSATGGEIGMRWEKGRFVPTDTPAAATGASTDIDRAAAASKAEREFLALVERFNSEGRNVSPSRSGSYAPALFAKHPQSEGITKRQFEIAMDTLLAAGRIQIVEVGPPSRRVKNIVVTPETGG